MKFCPVCKTRYDEEILRFCTKDGTPLVEDSQPNFTAMPSRDDLGEDTVIRRKTPPPPIPSTAQPVPDFDDEPERISSPRIVIPMSDDPIAEEMPRRREGVRTMTTESVRRQPPPRQSNTAMVVALTVLGTIVILGGGGFIFWSLNNQNSDSNQNTNFNTNLNSIDINLNTNLSVGNTLADFNTSVNANLNGNTNSNANANSNANLKTPTPTRTPTPTPVTNANVATNINSAVNSNSNLPPSVTATPTVRPTASPTPRPSPSNDEQSPSNRPPVNAGILNSRAVNLPKPAYPPNARQMHAEGQVAVQVSVDEAGNVTSAKATSGNPLLRASAEAAARQSRFNPVRVNNQPVPAIGIVLYNFVN
jgi:TonB family protein